MAIYLEPWHPDVFDFLEIRSNTGDQSTKCRDLFTAMYIPDLFMQMVEQDQDWYLFSPNESPGLTNSWGKKFESLYFNYVIEGKHVKKKIEIK